MAIRKDLDDMLNNLKTGNALETPNKPEPKTIPRLSDKKIDNMSVDDLVSSINGVKKEAPEQPEAPAAAPRKKRIVISHELPDYEAIRAEELKRQQLEDQRIEAEKAAAERAERDRLRAEREAEMARIEAERRAAKEAEMARIEAEKRAAEEAEMARIEAEKRAAEEAEMARIEAERRAAEEAEMARIEAERRAAEEAEMARIEAEKRAAEEARIAEFEAKKAEAKRARLEAEQKAVEQAKLDRYAEDEKNFKELQPEAFKERQPVVLNDNESSQADEAVPASSNSVEPPEKNAHDMAMDELDRQYLEEMLGTNKVPFWKRRKAKKAEAAENSENSETTEAPVEKKRGKIASMLQNILEEDPDEIVNQRKAQLDEGDEPGKGRFKKGFYAVFGVIFGVLACIGIVTVIAKAVATFGSYTSGDSKKEEFENAIYPAVIMDIESFASPSELPSDQIITAAIWSMIMKRDVTSKYEQTFDVVIIPATDVESAAVKLFGDELPKLEHTTVGPAGSQFYYNEETKSYNVPISPVTYTYAPEVREATKTGSEYTVTVDYIDELPSWLPKTSTKSVEYVLVEENGSYLLKSMKILSTNTNAV